LNNKKAYDREIALKGRACNKNRKDARIAIRRAKRRFIRNLKEKKRFERIKRRREERKLRRVARRVRREKRIERRRAGIKLTREQLLKKKEKKELLQEEKLNIEED